MIELVHNQFHDFNHFLLAINIVERDMQQIGPQRDILFITALDWLQYFLFVHFNAIGESTDIRHKVRQHTRTADIWLHQELLSNIITFDDSQKVIHQEFWDKHSMDTNSDKFRWIYLCFKVIHNTSSQSHTVFLLDLARRITRYIG